VEPAAHRGATLLSLSTATYDHQSNVYDVVQRSYDDLRPFYDRPATCCDHDYLTPHADSWTTATLDSDYVRPSCDAGLADSGKYLQLQDSAVYYDYI